MHTTEVLLFIAGALVAGGLTMGGVTLGYFVDKRRVDSKGPSRADDRGDHVSPFDLAA